MYSVELSFGPFSRHRPPVLPICQQRHLPICQSGPPTPYNTYRPSRSRLAWLFLLCWQAAGRAASAATWPRTHPMPAVHSDDDVQLCDLWAGLSSVLDGKTNAKQNSTRSRTDASSTAHMCTMGGGGGGGARRFSRDPPSQVYW